MEDHRITGRFHHGEQATHQQAAGEQPAKQESDGEVESREAEGFGHFVLQMRIGLIMGVSLAYVQIIDVYAPIVFVYEETQRLTNKEAPAGGRGFVEVCDGASTRKLAQTVQK